MAFPSSDAVFTLLLKIGFMVQARKVDFLFVSITDSDDLNNLVIDEHLAKDLLHFIKRVKLVFLISFLTLSSLSALWDSLWGRFF